MGKLRTILGLFKSHNLRPFALILLLAGVGASIGFPLVAELIVVELSLAPSTVGLYFATAFVGPVVTVGTGRYSDAKTKNRSLILISGTMVGLGWLGMALSQSLWQLLIIGLLFHSFIGTFSSQIFTQLDRHLAQLGLDNANTIKSSVRATYTLGWVLGPIIGSLLSESIGVRSAVAVAGLMYLLSIATVSLSLNSSWSNKTADIATPLIQKTNAFRSTFRSLLPLLVFVALCTLAMSGDSMRSGYLPLTLDFAGIEGIQKGLVISFYPFAELFLLPITGALADSRSPLLVIKASLLLGSVGFGLFAIAGSSMTIYLTAQLLVAFMGAGILGTGLSISQQLGGNFHGTATSLYVASLSLAGALGGVLGSLSTLRLTLNQSFAIPAVLCLLAAVALLLLNQQLIRSSEESLTIRSPL